jgi:hypothetical protein
MNIEQAVAQSISTTSVVKLTLSGHASRAYETILAAMDEAVDSEAVHYWDSSEEDDGSWDVTGTNHDSQEFRLRITVA